ncbi:hypothetical protein CQA57_05745 [Helicobacter anseris]|uniref:Conjugal transfer protein n=1 Tax=Helicobacter anseris TaxID=375926 RepID=A0A3D8J6F1_9HELI|nr:conjugal transfer protein TraH [Helicobacter anseris]RDU73028.1 hypothetical protein CQA57_05745 [Helicobacter anseris]
MLKKIFNLIFVLIFATSNTLAASGLDDFWNSMKEGFNNSKFGQFFNDRGWSNFTNSTYNQTGDSYGGSYIGGSGSFRFSDDQSSYKPWIDWEAPSVEADCNGLKFNLGFASLVDFDDIAENLGNVGGAVIFGILVALINSLPTLNQAFSQIKALVQYIQNLLRNACNFSKNIASDLIKQGQNYLKDQASQPDAGFAMKTANIFANGQDYLSSANNLVNTTVSEYKTKFLNAVKGKNGGASDTGKKLSNEYERMAESFYRVGYFPSILISQYLPENDVIAKKVVPLTIADISVNGSLDLSSPKTFYLLAVNIVGDPEGMSANALADLQFSKNGKTIVDFNNAMIANGKVDSSYDQISNHFAEEKFAQEKGDVKLSPPTPNVLVGGKSQTFLHDLLYGTTSKTIKIDSQKIAYAQTVSKSNKVYQMFRTLQNQGKSQTVKWEGLETESLKAIVCILKRSSSNTRVASVVYEDANNVSCNGNISNSSSTNESFALIAPDWAVKINEIVLFALDYLKNKPTFSGTMDGERAKSLAILLAKQNAIYYAQFLMDNIRNIYENNTTSIKSESIKNKDKLMNELRKYKNDLEEELEKQINLLNNFETMYDNAGKKKKAQSIQK